MGLGSDAALALLAFLIVGATSMGALHAYSWTSAVLGILAASWVFLPMMQWHNVKRSDVLHPAPRRYPVPWKTAFTKVRTIFDRATYRSGQARWKVDTDTNARQIHAGMQFYDEDLKPAVLDNGAKFKRERVSRFVEADVQFAAEDDACVITLSFKVELEDEHNFQAADFAIEHIKGAIEEALGAGAPVEKAPVFELQPPPWALLVLTGVALLVYGGDVIGALMK